MHPPAPNPLSNSFSARRAALALAQSRPIHTSSAPASDPLPWVQDQVASSSSSRNTVGLGLGSEDMSNTMRSTGLGISAPAARGAGGISAVVDLDPNTDRENVPLPSAFPSTAYPPTTTSTTTADSPTKSPMHLRVGSLSHHSPSRPSSAQYTSASSPSRAFSSILSSFLPSRRRRAPSITDDLSTLQYPRSPSLLRPPPTVRHSAGRRTCLSLRRLILTLCAVSLLAILYASTVEEETRREKWNSFRAKLSSSNFSASDASRANVVNYGDMLDALRSGGGNGHASHHPAGWGAAKEVVVPKPVAVEAPSPAVRAAEQDSMNADDLGGSAAEPVRLIEIEKVDSREEEGDDANERRPKPHLAVKVGKEEDTPAKEDEKPKPTKEDLPFLTDKSAPTPSDDLNEPDAEDEQAGLAAVVKQAEQEDAKQDADAEEVTESLEQVIEEEREAAPPARLKAQQKEKEQSNRVEEVVAIPPEAEAKAKKAVEKALSNAAKKARRKKKKDASRYKRLLPLGAPPRRYLYGANFVIAADEVDASTVATNELTNEQIKIPSKKQLKKMFDSGKKRYLEEADDWRNYEWKAPPAHASLQRFVDRLKADERALRDWIKRVHASPPSQPIGLAAPLDAVFTPATTDLALVGEPPIFDRGNRDKWTDLVLQAQEGHAGKCKGNKWLDDYQKLHAEMLAGEREPKFISYHCETGMNCGGLGDRLLGMTSTFFFGLITQRAFLSEWQSPIPLDIIFDSPHVNWSHSSFTSSRHPVLGQKRLADAAADLDVIHFDRLSVDATFGTTSWNPPKNRALTPGFELRDLAYKSPWIKFYTNRGMIYRAFKYKHLQKSINRLGLEPTTAFACISEYLFKPKLPALDLITQYTSVLALPTIFSVGIHIRTGDQSMRDEVYDKVNTVKRHIAFFRCARELGETYARKDQKVVFFLITDSQHLKQDAQRVLGNKLITTDMVPQHVHQKSGHVDGVMSAVVEDWILAKADMLVATQDSGFGKLASFMMAKPNATVTIFPRFNPDVMGLQSKKSHLRVDCTSPTVFTSFEELSSEWSLG
ncbi:hypothetical protein NBRC10512_001570 [Rhodotorula toruloides]|uniref:RHTO0S12e03774g1_1 n=2 Tax=Rhodotorula toruloides TaxID=5286 RepID=A0A061BEP8_RHOTO|nr:uncharacterized protein RHTO_07514 [Rhodotorula toruloides NP11]EMS23172.1 hypothetical protein RHTO_07514 [Rhodotorula toruloides NP11]CDR46371.1 RHTO0S12e03774g1_1 [Rhodotorula toruloides]